AALATCYFFVPPVHSLAIESFDDALRVGMFVLVAVLTGSLSAAQRRAEAERGQQAVVAEVGRLALAGGELSGLMHEAVTHVARTLGIEYAAVWELPSDGRAASLCAAVRCRGGMVEDITLDPDVLSDASLLIDDGANLPACNGVTLVKVIIRGPDGPLGVLSAHATRPRRLAPHDGHFLRAVAHVLGEAMTRKRAEEQRAGLLVRERAARAHAEAASRAKEDLLATVSHELRAPLAQLVTWSRLLRRGKVDETALEAIDRSTRTLERLAGDLLDVARITAGKLSLAIRPLVLGGTVSGALDALRVAAEAQGLALGLAIVRELVELHGGTVCAESAGEGRGARFTVILPLAPAATEALGGGSMTACAS